MQNLPIVPSRESARRYTAGGTEIETEAWLAGFRAALAAQATDPGPDLVREAQDEEAAYAAQHQQPLEAPGYSPPTHRTKTQPLTEELDRPDGLLSFFQSRLESWLVDQPDVDLIDTFQDDDTVKGVSFQLAGYGRVKIHTAGGN